MSKVVCVTNRALCTEDFLTRIARIAAARPRAIILREKDLSPDGYTALAQAVGAHCAAHGVPLVLNGYPALAAQMGAGVQLSFSAHMQTPSCPFGVSVHTPEEAAAAAAKGAAWLIAGHIWETGCKAGLPGRGLSFLRAAVEAAQGAPVYAIGGITPARLPAVMATGAAGACVMSALMRCPDPAAYLAAFDCDSQLNQ